MSKHSRIHVKAQVVKNVSPQEVQNKNKRIIKDTCFAITGLLNNRHGGTLTLRSSKPFTPTALDELVRGIEQTLIEFLGLTRFHECCQTEIKGFGKEIVFAVQPSDQVCTVEYNLVLPTDFQVRQVLRTEPLEKIARLLKAGPMVNSNLRNYVREFQKESIAPGELRESKTVQFKKIKSDKNKNKSTADRILANKITHYVAAFANHQGGHVYIGIDDDTYTVCGQLVVEEEKERILEKVGSAIANMVWPEEHGKPQRGKHWDIVFVPVLDGDKEIIPDLFVIVISIACCPGGVFLSFPESYVIKDGEVVQIEFHEWKKRLLHDAHMRDIVKFSRENYWKESNTRQITRDEQNSEPRSEQNSEPRSGPNSEPCSGPNSEPPSERNSEPRSECILETAICDAERRQTIPATMPQIAPRMTKSRRMCRKITDFMEQLIQDGNFDQLKSFASKSRDMCKTFCDADIEVAVRLMLALGAYRRRQFEIAYEELAKASCLITSTENPAELEVQRLHLLACFLRGNGEHSESYKVTCGGLQEMEMIPAGWHTAWMLNDAGYLFSILAGGERNGEVRKSLKQQAVTLYTKAIAHTSAIGKDATESCEVSVMKSNLLHRCHLRLAMVSLDCTPLAEKDDDIIEVSNADIDVAITNILVVEESSLKEDSLTDVNECYLDLVKSDLNYRKSQLDVDHCEKLLRKAKECAGKAHERAKTDQFQGILKYAESRLSRLSKVHCCSSEEEQLFTDLDTCKGRC